MRCKSQRSKPNMAESLCGRESQQLFEADVYRTEAEVAEFLQVPRKYARSCLMSLVAGGTLEKHPRPLRYRHRGRLVPSGSDHGESDPKDDSPSST